jgi:sortase A
MMDRMASNGGERLRAPVRRARLGFAAATLAALALSACGGSAQNASGATDAAAPPATTAPPPTTVPRTTTSTTKPSTKPTSTTSTSTTSASTTTSSATSTTAVASAALVLPQPISPPTDENGTEPIIELGSIEIPAIDVYVAMYEGIRLTTLDYGPGHWPGTAMPGKIGNTVVAGHRTSKHRVFRNIDQLVPGDEIIFDGLDGRHVYHVTRTEIVGPDAVWIVDQTPEITATLFACHPPGSTRERIVVFAELAP